MFVTIPPHAELIRAMCAYDLLGFQTELDRTAFVDYVLRYAGGVAAEDGAIRIASHTLRTGVYPIGVHVDEVRAQAETPVNRRQATRLRANLLERLILSVDRLDYSKGLRPALRRVRALPCGLPAAARPGHLHADRAALALRHRNLSA